MEREREGLPGQGMLWKMARVLYGRRPAAKAWTTWLAADMIGRCGLERFAAVPTLFALPNTKLRLEVHMDDGHGAGTLDECKAFLELLGENVLIETNWTSWSRGGVQRSWS